MTQNEWEKEALIERLRTELNPDGTLNTDSAIEVRVNYNEARDVIFDPEETRRQDGDEEAEKQLERWEPGEVIETDFRNGAHARLRYDVDEEGTARLSAFKDASPSSGDWISVEFLRIAHAAMEVVEHVPGVDRVEPTTHTLNNHIQDGKNAEVRRA